MNPPTAPRATLHVEGSDDKWTIIHVLKRHGIDFDKRLDKQWRWLPELMIEKSENQLRENVPLILKTNAHATVGFIIDADISATQRWESLKNFFRDAGVDTPDALPADGFVGWSKMYQKQVGCWIMPDNLSTGAIEAFLRQLIRQEDGLIRYAQSATRTAFRKDSRFRPVDRAKAELHCWLAWQESPGLPYGTAVKAEYFKTHQELAARFVVWFRRLYEPATDAVS